MSPLNFGTFAAFLCWFGGIGYLLERYSTIWAYLALLISIMSGLGGAAIIFWFLWKLNQHEQPLGARSFRGRELRAGLCVET